MTGARHPDCGFVAIFLFVILAASGLPGAVLADEASDLTRILELNDAYAEASRARRAGEITRAEMQAQQKAIQQESRQINNSYGRAGSPERRAWDQKVLAAKNAHAKELRREAEAATAERRAEERAASQAAAAEKRAAAEARAAERAAMERAAALTRPLVPIKLSAALQPEGALQQDALELAPLLQEARAIGVERSRLAGRSNGTSQDQDRISLIDDRLAIIQPEIDGIRAGYGDNADELRALNLMAQALAGDYAGIEKEDIQGWPQPLAGMVRANTAWGSAAFQANLRRSVEAAEERKRAANRHPVFNEDYGQLALIAAILIGVAMSFGAPRGIASLAADGTSMRLAGWKYDLSTLSGVLLDSQQRTEERTLIQESGGTGVVVGGHGYITPRQEAVKDITTFDHLFVRDDTGQEHEVELEDFELRLRPGNRITVVRATGARGNERPILLYNQDTRKHFYSTRVMRDLLKPSFLWALLHAGLVAMIAMGLGFPLVDRGEVLASSLTIVFCMYWIGGNRLTVAAIRAGLFDMGSTAKALVAQVSGSSGGEPETASA